MQTNLASGSEAAQHNLNTALENGQLARQGLSLPGAWTIVRWHIHSCPDQVQARRLSSGMTYLGPM